MLIAIAVLGLFSAKFHYMKIFFATAALILLLPPLVKSVVTNSVAVLYMRSQCYCLRAWILNVFNEKCTLALKYIGILTF